MSVIPAVVLGAGTVGRAAAWDLARRGYELVIADRSAAAAAAVGNELQVRHLRLDVQDREALRPVLDRTALVIAAVPFQLGKAVASVAVAAGAHYFDFGGNPRVVQQQLTLDGAARAAGVAVVPDCGLAPGLANVLAVGAVASLGPGPIDEVRIRVGALPRQPSGALGYQLAFNPAGLINEYSEPCEVLRDGRRTTLPALTELEQMSWERWGPLEAFNTAGGISSLARLWEGRVAELDYKTLRYPGHAAAFRAFLELGFFEAGPWSVADVEIAPRALLLKALDERLPRGEDDVVLVRTWAAAVRDGERTTAGYEVEDTGDGTFSALARTTAFPTTALADLVVSGRVQLTGATTMDVAVEAPTLLEELAPLGINPVPELPWAGPNGRTRHGRC
ncbi:MAG: saccharopine dehydrogenase family protein [Acidimicrobiia bacterium]